MSDYKKEFDKLHKNIEEKKIEQAKLEERLENLQKEEKQISEDLKELNVTSDELEGVICDLEKDIKEELEKCQQSLN